MKLTFLDVVIQVRYEGSKWYNLNNQRYFVHINNTLTLNASVLETRIDDLLADVRFTITVATSTHTNEQWSIPVYVTTPIDGETSGQIFKCIGQTSMLILVPEVPLLPSDSLSNKHQSIALSQPSNINGPIK